MLRDGDGDVTSQFGLLLSLLTMTPEQGMPMDYVMLSPVNFK